MRSRRVGILLLQGVDLLLGLDQLGADRLEPFLQGGLLLGQSGQRGENLAGVRHLLLERGALTGQGLVVRGEFFILPFQPLADGGHVPQPRLQMVKLLLVDGGRLRLLGAHQGAIGLGEGLVGLARA